jgi:hypothetical protein
VVSCDIIEASARAYLNAVNKIAQKTVRQTSEKKKETKQKESPLKRLKPWSEGTCPEPAEGTLHNNPICHV